MPISVKVNFKDKSDHEWEIELSEQEPSMFDEELINRMFKLREKILELKPQG